MILKRIAKTADEKDTHSRWRHIMCRYHRPGAALKVKTATNRRERRDGKASLRRGDS